MVEDSTPKGGNADEDSSEKNGSELNELEEDHHFRVGVCTCKI